MASVNMWVWIGIGSSLIALLVIVVAWICTKLNLLTSIRFPWLESNPNNRRQRFRNLTLTLRREITRVNAFVDDNSYSLSAKQSLHNDSAYFNNYFKDYPNSTHRQHFQFVQDVTTSNHATQQSFDKPRSLYEGFPSRSMSRILWQDLTMTNSDNAIIEEEYTEKKLLSRERNSFSRKENVEIRQICKTSHRIFRQAWGKNSVKIFLFSKLVAGYFTVDRSGKLCKVNDWRHVSGEDLRYREKAIFELVCLNQLHITLYQDV